MCVASNIAGNLTQQVQLSVFGKQFSHACHYTCWLEQLQYAHCPVQQQEFDDLPFCPSVPPRIQAGPRVMKVQVGYPVELLCIVRGVPEPVLMWTKDGVSYPVSPDGSLAFGTVRLDDEGTYTCTATNTAGRDEARVQLLVQGWFYYKDIVFSRVPVSS